MDMVREGGRLVIRQKGEELWVEPWGENGVRVRMTAGGRMDTRDWALEQRPETPEAAIEIREADVVEPWYRDAPDRESHVLRGKTATVRNGAVTVSVDAEGCLSFHGRDGGLLLREYWRNRSRLDRYAAPLKYAAREWKAVPGAGEYRLVARFEATPGEQIYGMGQYQEANLNKKGSVLELSQRNTQISIPFYLSSLGYGFLWNNPAVGTACFGENRMEWVAERTKKLDYFLTAGDTPRQIIAQYTAAVGRAPLMPEFGLGFWQSKLRYRTQEELLRTARQMKERDIPVSVMVVDFFHWPRQGDFRMEPEDWPDPGAMVEELRSYGIEPMVSVWPTSDAASENRAEMEERGYLVRVDRGLPIHMNWMGEVTFLDFFHPGCKRYVWEKCRAHYYRHGVKAFWLDEAEPEFGVYDFDINRYWEGPALEVGNAYPLHYAKAFYDGLREAGEERVLNLVRCAWAGSQKYGALVWSGDVHSSFRALREQLQAGLNIGIAGIPWWTTDIGGFLGGWGADPAFRELLIRWTQWAVFCPVMRLHGARQPFLPLEELYRDGKKQFTSGGDNEPWSFGEEVYGAMRRCIALREELRPYLGACMREAHETGMPLLRAMFLEFPQDGAAWRAEDQYMLGGGLLVAPVMEQGARTRRVWLPGGETWTDFWTGEERAGGAAIVAEAPLDRIPVYIRGGHTAHIRAKRRREAAHE